MKNFMRFSMIILFLVTSVSAFANRPFPDNARQVQVNGEYTQYTLTRNNDTDWFQFTLEEASDRLRVRVLFNDDPADIDVKLFEEDGNELSRLDTSDSTNDNERLTVWNVPAGTYWVKIYVYDSEWNRLEETEEAGEEVESTSISYTVGVTNRPEEGEAEAEPEAVEPTEPGEGEPEGPGEAPEEPVEAPEEPVEEAEEG